MKRSILVYDDEEDILNFCKIIFEKLDYHVETRNQCDYIVEDIKQIRPNIILMDLRIPMIGGEKAIELYKNNEETNHVPVILFSANPDIGKIADRVLANGYLKKPFEIAELLHIIETNVLAMSNPI